MKTKEELKYVFDSYISNYDLNNKKIYLKYIHTFKVADLSEKIAISLNLSAEQIYISYIIGLLHDIGRFDQIKSYNTFNDSKSIDHAKHGAQILKQNNFLHKFIDNSKYDQLILDSIYYHNKFQIPEDNKFSDADIMFFKIIRDADKIDIYRIISTTDYLLNNNKFDLSQVSDIIIKKIKEHKLINHKEKNTRSDDILSSIAFVFDINFKYSFEYLKQKKYISIYIDNIIKPKDQKSKDFIESVKLDIDKYILEKR